MFPILNTKMDFSGEHSQHEALHDFLDKFLAIIKSSQTNSAEFDAAKVKNLMQESKDIMVRFRSISMSSPNRPFWLKFNHFDDELTHIEASKLREAQFTEDEVKEMVSSMEKHAKANGDPFLVVPFMRSHTTPEYKDIWPAMPWILRKVAIPYILAKKHSGYDFGYYSCYR